MKDFIKNYLLQTYQVDISDQNINLLMDMLTYKKFTKKQTIIPHGKPTTNFFILIDGIVGSFVKNTDNKNFIRTLYTKGRAIGALTSLIQKNIVANASYMCLTNCEVLEGDFNDFIKLKETNKDFELIYHRILEETYIRTEKKFDDICSLNAKERFLNLNRDVPDICNLLPQYQIANYLNITPVQLSRIRKQLLNE